MENWLARTELLIGEKGVKTLAESTVAVIGLGGVGGSAAEALCRAGVGTIIAVDHDTVDITNLNRQLLATAENVGEKKCVTAKKRLLSINPNADVKALDIFYLPENRDRLFNLKPDFIIDAIDTVTAKLDLIEQCADRGIGIVSSMGTGNRLDPSRFVIGKIEDTANGCGCPLARVMRRELKKRGVVGANVLYSTEPAIKAIVPESENGRHSPGSISFVPPVAGYMLAGFAVKSLIKGK